MYVCIANLLQLQYIQTFMAKEERRITLDDIRSSDECKIPQNHALFYVCTLLLYIVCCILPHALCTDA